MKYVIAVKSLVNDNWGYLNDNKSIVCTRTGFNKKYSSRKYAFKAITKLLQLTTRACIVVPADKTYTNDELNNIYKQQSRVRKIKEHLDNYEKGV